MSESKHTPGPWQSEGPDFFGDFNIILAGSAGEHDKRAVAAVVSNLRSEEEVVANAHLIAAAPDMLEALRPFARLAAHRPADDPDELIVANYRESLARDAISTPVTLGDCRAAAAAIAKAEGRSDA